MNRKEYEKTKDYQKSIEMFRSFVKDILDGDLENLRNLDFEDIATHSLGKKYVGNSKDPDMYPITQAIYIILWGNLYDLSFGKMGSWNQNNKFAFRGDSINSFGSVIGKKDEKNGTNFAFRAKFYEADKNPNLWRKIVEFHKLYHNSGNFIVIPNRGTVEGGINGARGKYYDSEVCECMRDYFDWFLIVVSQYQKKIKTGDIRFSKFERQLHLNPEYNPSFLEIAEWEDRFFLKPFFKNGEPELLFKTPLKDRLKVTDPNRRGSHFYGTTEYLELLEDYLDKSKEVIQYRTNKIIEVLKEKLKSAKLKQE